MTRTYATTPQDAEAFRAELDTARAKLQALKAEGKPSKLGPKAVREYNAQVAELQAQVDQLNVQLKDAPPPPLTPDQAWKMVQDVFDGPKASAEKSIAKFQKEAATNLMYATQWYIADAIIGETTIKSFRWFYAIAELDKTNERRLEIFAEKYPQFVENLKSEVMRRARNFMSRSTSVQSNFAEDCENQAYGQLLTEFTDNSSCWRISMAQERLEVWKQLQNA